MAAAAETFWGAVTWSWWLGPVFETHECRWLQVFGFSVKVIVCDSTTLSGNAFLPALLSFLTAQCPQTEQGCSGWLTSSPDLVLHSKSVSHENHALTQWFRWVTHGPAHGRRWKAPFLVFLRWHNARADSLRGSPWSLASSQPAALTSGARCPGFIDDVVSMEGVRCLVSPKTGPFCELSWKSGKLCSSSLRYKEKGVLLCAFSHGSGRQRPGCCLPLATPREAGASQQDNSCPPEFGL